MLNISYVSGKEIKFYLGCQLLILSAWVATKVVPGEDEMIASTLDAFLNSYATSQQEIRTHVAVARACGRGGGAEGAGDHQQCRARGNAHSPAAWRRGSARRSWNRMPRPSCWTPCATHRLPAIWTHWPVRKLRSTRKGRWPSRSHPLDGMSNIDINAALGTIFSVLPAEHGQAREAPSCSPADGNWPRASSSTDRNSVWC